VADRFGLSTLCYQVAGRGLPRAAVTAALELATQGVRPDLTLVLDVPVAVGRERQRRVQKRQDRFERADDAFHERVRQAYLEYQGPGVVHLDATQPKRMVREAAWQEVAAVTALSLRGIA
jgi:dTMP kinase